MNTHVTKKQAMRYLCMEKDASRLVRRLVLRMEAIIDFAQSVCAQDPNEGDTTFEAHPVGDSTWSAPNNPHLVICPHAAMRAAWETVEPDFERLLSTFDDFGAAGFKPPESLVMAMVWADHVREHWKDGSIDFAGTHASYFELDDLGPEDG